MIIAKDIYKSFGGLEVIKGISLVVNAGEVLSIIGSSGSGKSTMLRCLNRLETVDKGYVEVDGQIMCQNDSSGNAVYSRKEVLSGISQNMGMVFQQFNLFPHFSVLRNVYEALVVVRKMDKQQAVDIAMEALRKTGLDNRAEAYPYQLSGGQQQRVAISRALALSPKYLCFDEPTSSLDPELTGEVLEVIKSLKGSTTMIVVTHEMGFARDVSDRIIFMEKGIIADEGTPDEIFNNPQNARTAQFVGHYLK